MDEKGSNKKRKIDELLKLLNSTSEQDILNAINRLKVHGNETVLEPLLDKFIETNFDDVKNEILIFFSELKSTKAPAIIINLLKNEKYDKAQALFLNTMWNTGLDYSGYICDICKFAIKGDFMIAFECFTILDNLNDLSFNVEDINDGIIALKEYFAENQEDSDKNGILHDILGIVSTIESSL